MTDENIKTMTDEQFSCPIKESCSHYKAKINIKKELYFYKPPYNFVKKKCEFFSEIKIYPVIEFIKTLPDAGNKI